MKQRSIVWDVLFLLVSLWSVQHWWTHHPVSITGRLFSASFFFLCVLALASNVVLVRVQRKAARRILEQSRGLYSGPHEYRIASLDEFPKLDRAFYEWCREWFEAKGFRYLGDRENVTVRQVFPKSKSLLRTFVSGDYTIVGVACHLKSQGRTLKEFKTIEFESELSDGTFVTTSNTLDSERVPPVPRIMANRYPAETPPEELLARHRQSLEGRPSWTSLRYCRSMDEVIQFQHRMHAIKVRHKEARGLVDESDLKAVQRRELNQHEQAIADEIERLKRDGA